MEKDSVYRLYTTHIERSDAIAVENMEHSLFFPHVANNRRNSDFEQRNGRNAELHNT